MDESRRKRVVAISVIAGFLAAFPFMAAATFVYLRYGDPPVATADKPFPYEETIVHIPLNARIDRQLATAPLSPTSDNLVAGAHVYVAHCAVCHGKPGQNSSLGKWEYPSAPQLWTKHANGVVGVSDDPSNVSYWKVKNGIRITGMPSFQHILTESEMWQVSLLIAQADKQQLPAVTETFDRENSLRSQSESEQMQQSEKSPVNTK
jgi:mono/diheme cytochrome c family protein